MKRHLLCCAFLFSLASLSVHAQQNKQSETFADRWEYKGIAVDEPGYHVWGASPIVDAEGKIHLFAARWKTEHKFDPGWRSHSEIAHYVADCEEEPFRFVDVVLQGTGKKSWDKYGIHNPTIHKVGAHYVLLYISNDDYHQPPHPGNQRIGMLLADNLNGPWKKAGKDGCILSPSTQSANWTHNASNGVNNPALLQHPNGGFLLYFKSEGSKMGVAFAEHIEGPYVIYPEPVTRNKITIEDGYAFFWNNRVCLLTTDNHGIIKRGGGILWTSEDGIHFDEKQAGFYPLKQHIPAKYIRNNGRQLYGAMPKFERPQVLMQEGEPRWIYMPSGFNINGEDHTIVYVMRRK